eukprot:Hpha_TRINITY_DN10175_c0_g1::TRINITY_DN10175_c0_g1_i1::g.131716::m.131716
MQQRPAGMASLPPPPPSAPAGALLQPQSRARRRVDVLESHLDMSRQEGATRSTRADDELRIPPPAVARSNHIGGKWLYPTLAVAVAAAGTAGVTAWRKKDALVEKVVPYGWRAAAWFIKSRLGAGSDGETLTRQRQLEAILRGSDAATLRELKRLHGQLKDRFPLERQLAEIRKHTGLSAEEKIARWCDFQVTVLGRMTAALYALSLVLFVTRAAHALEAAVTDAREWADHAAVVSCRSPGRQVLRSLDIDFLSEIARRSCREVLEEGEVGMTTTLTADQVGGLVKDARRRIDSGLLRPKGRKLHDVVLGEEGAEEPRLVQQLRDLLSADESVGVLRRMLDCVFGVALQHCEAAVRELLPAASHNSREGTNGKNGLSRVANGHSGGCHANAAMGVRIFPKLTPELDRVCESNNEFLLSLKGAEDDSESDSFFLSLFQLQLQSARRGQPAR